MPGGKQKSSGQVCARLWITAFIRERRSEGWNGKTSQLFAASGGASSLERMPCKWSIRREIPEWENNLVR